MKEIIRKSDVQDVMRDANLLPPGSRTGHDSRVAAMNHIEKMRDDGYIDEAEAATRLHYVSAAKTNQELQVFTADLPAPADPRTTRQRIIDSYNFQKKAWFVPILLVMTIGFAVLAVLPSTIAGNDHWWTTLHGMVLCVPSILIGSVMATTSACWLIAKASRRESG
jgi:hypothetical protein